MRPARWAAFGGLLFLRRARHRHTRSCIFSGDVRPGARRWSPGVCSPGCCPTGIAAERWAL